MDVSPSITPLNVDNNYYCGPLSTFLLDKKMDKCMGLKRRL